MIALQKELKELKERDNTRQNQLGHDLQLQAERHAVSVSFQFRSLSDHSF